MAGTSISLPAQLEVEVEKIMRQEFKSKSEVIRDALLAYIKAKSGSDNKGRSRIK